MQKTRDLCFQNALIAFQNNHLNEAIIWFKDALNQPFLGGPNNNALIFNNIGTIYNKCKMYDDSKTYYLKALDAGLSNDNIYFSLAATYIHLNENKNAIDIYNNLISSNENNGKAYYLRGKHLQRMGDYLRGSNDIGKAASLNYYG